jgi:uncharacterized protein YciI
MTMQQFVYFVQPPRPSFINDATPAESALMGEHFQYLKRLLADGHLILAGPMLVEGGFGITVFEAEDEEAARKLAQGDPAVAAGLVRAELHPFRVSLLRGRDLVPAGD